eukprot:scaffold11785_cov92-Isochrysis_galbana.AAC.1
MSPGQDRGVVCKAFESLVRKGLSVEEVAREFSPPLVFDASFASRGAEKRRESWSLRGLRLSQREGAP